MTKMFITLLIAIILAQLLFPWWIIAPISMLISFIFNKGPAPTFFICFMAIFCTWLCYAYYQSVANDHILANRIGSLFGLGQSKHNWVWITLASGLTGGIVAGIAGLSGQYIRKVKIQK